MKSIKDSAFSPNAFRKDLIFLPKGTPLKDWQLTPVNIVQLDKLLKFFRLNLEWMAYLEQDILPYANGQVFSRKQTAQLLLSSQTKVEQLWF